MAATGLEAESGIFTEGGDQVPNQAAFGGCCDLAEWVGELTFGEAGPIEALVDGEAAFGPER
jgi:hypothetical protein